MIDQVTIHAIKKAYGVEHLYFYCGRVKGGRNGLWHCKYIGPNKLMPRQSEETDHELDFFLKALSTQQGKVFFDDCCQTCTGLDELKTLLLTMVLAGL
jgi:hypothetical protein